MSVKIHNRQIIIIVTSFKWILNILKNGHFYKKIKQEIQLYHELQSIELFQYCNH